MHPSISSIGFAAIVASLIFTSSVAALNTVKAYDCVCGQNCPSIADIDLNNNRNEDGYCFDSPMAAAFVLYSDDYLNCEAYSEEGCQGEAQNVGIWGNKGEACTNFNYGWAYSIKCWTTNKK